MPELTKMLCNGKKAVTFTKAETNIINSYRNLVSDFKTLWIYFQCSQNDQVSGLYFYEIFFAAALLYENSKAVSKVRAKGVCC